MTENTKSTFEDELEKNGVLFYGTVGDSMEPLIKEGKTLVEIRKKPEGRLRRLDVPLYRRASGQYVLHRILKVRKNDYVLCGDNRWKPETGISDRQIIGIMTAVIDTETGKRLSVDDPEYRSCVRERIRRHPLRAAASLLSALHKKTEGLSGKRRGN